MADVRAKALEVAADLRRKLAEIDRLSGASGLRASEAARKKAAREAAHVVTVPPCKDAAQRALLERDVFEWLRFYFADIFTYEFTSQQREMITAIRDALLVGGDQAIAASRGEGKTTLAECVLVYCVLTGAVRFAVLFSATGELATKSLDTIKGHIADNETLCDYYPEVCVPVRALENTPQRANYQRVVGRRHDTGEPYGPVQTQFSWCGREVQFPRVPGSTCSGAVIATRGLDAAVRGLKVGNMRPDLAVIDDPDTAETVNSEEQAAKLEDKIERAIAGLAGQRRGIARVMLTTIQKPKCVSAKFTDRTQKPSWSGRRFKFLPSMPDRMDLWDEFVTMQRADWVADPNTTKAREFYVAHRAEMEAGAVVANPHRYVAGELSALEHFFIKVARSDWPAVLTEYQNDPPEELGPVESGITAHRICKQLSGYQRGVIPEGCVFLTMGCDVGKWYLHWVVRAWKADGTGYTIDYGEKAVYGVTRNTDDGLDMALHRAIVSLLEERDQSEYQQDGERKTIDLVLIDGRYRTDAVYATVQPLYPKVRAVMGHGRSHGCVGTQYRPVLTVTQRSRPLGVGCDERVQQCGSGYLWVTNADADQWKAWEHDRWMSDPTKPGAMFLFGENGKDPRGLSGDEVTHQQYAKHICGEVEVEESDNGLLRRYWKKKNENHWLDASYYADVAAHILGVKVTAALPAVVARHRRSAVLSTGFGRPDGRTFV